MCTFTESLRLSAFLLSMSWIFYYNLLKLEEQHLIYTMSHFYQNFSSLSYIKFPLKFKKGETKGWGWGNRSHLRPKLTYDLHSATARPRGLGSLDFY